MYRKQKVSGSVIERSPQQVQTSHTKPKFEQKTSVNNPNPLHEAVREEACPSTVVEILAGSSKVDDRDELGNTALHICALTGNVKWLKILVHSGASLEVLNGQQQSPLMMASQEANASVVKELIEIGAPVNQRNDHGEISLHYAIIGGSLVCVKLLLSAKSKINCLAVNENGTPLTLACQLQKVSIVQELVSYRGPPRINLNMSDRSSYGRMPIHWAVHSANVPCLNILIEAGVELDIVDGHGVTPLVQAITGGSAEALDILVKAGCDTMAVDGLNGTTLTLSALLGQTACLKVLLNANEDPNEVGHFGLTPLSCATFESNVESVDTLLEYGADPNVRSRNGLSPLLACLMKVTEENADKRHQILASLIRGGADVRGDKCNKSVFRSTNSGTCDPANSAMSTGYISLLKLILIGGGVIHCKLAKQWVAQNDLYECGDYKETVCPYFVNVHSLKEMCRWSIRAGIIGPKRLGIKQLPLPEQLKAFLNYCDMDEITIQRAKTKCSIQEPMLKMLTRSVIGIRTLRGTLLYESIHE